MQVLTVIRRCDDGDIQKPRTQPVEDIVAAAVPQTVLHTGVLLLEARYPARQVKRRTTLNAADGQKPRHFALQVAYLLPGLLGNVEHLHGPAV